MWLFTDTGFISAVTHRDDKNKMMVRARDKKSLESLAELAGTPIDKTPSADYPWRTTVTKKVLKQWMSKSIDDAEYDNFKSRVSKTRGYEFVDALHEVWSVMHRVEEGHVKNTKRSWWNEHDELDQEFFAGNGSDSLDGDASSDFWGIDGYLDRTKRKHSNAGSNSRRRTQPNSRRTIS